MDKPNFEADEGGRRMVSSYHACKQLPIEIIEAGAVERLIRVCKAFLAGDVSESELAEMMKTMGIIDEKTEGATGG